VGGCGFGVGGGGGGGGGGAKPGRRDALEKLLLIGRCIDGSFRGLGRGLFWEEGELILGGATLLSVFFSCE